MEVRVSLNTNRCSADRRDAIVAAPVFGETFTDHMVTMSYVDGEWGALGLEPFGDLALSPAALALHYGQSIFEALKAYVEQPELRARHGAAGELRAHDFSWDRINHAVADTYLRLLRQKASSAA